MSRLPDVLIATSITCLVIITIVSIRTELKHSGLHSSWASSFIIRTLEISTAVGVIGRILLIESRSQPLCAFAVVSFTGGIVISKMFLVLFLFTRLQTIFQNTPYEPSPTCIRAFRSAVALFALISFPVVIFMPVAYMMAPRVNYNEFGCNYFETVSPPISRATQTAAGLIHTTDLILQLTLNIIFVQRLRAVYAMSQEAAPEMIDATMRITVLVSFAFVTTVLIFWLVGFVIIPGLILTEVDVTINLVAISLTFRCNIWLYELACFPCDWWCQSNFRHELAKLGHDMNGEMDMNDNDNNNKT